MATRNKRSFKNKNRAKNAWFAKQVTPHGVNTPYDGSYISGKLGGVQVGNKSLQQYYGDKIKA
jgi:hypothetical protein|tara:strand:- start:444 stop:632 length:189 start_codon:yes stop_codon:yes gene_type:complete